MAGRRKEWRPGMPSDVWLLVWNNEMEIETTIFANEGGAKEEAERILMFYIDETHFGGEPEGRRAMEKLRAGDVRGARDEWQEWKERNFMSKYAADSLWWEETEVR